MFGRDSLPSVMYVYDIATRHPSWRSMGYVHDQLRLCRLYSNRLIELERKRRRLIERVRLIRFPEYAALEANLQFLLEEQFRLRNEINQQRQQQRKRSSVPADQRHHLDDMKQKIKELSTQLRADRTRFFENADFKKLLTRIDSRDARKRRRARACFSRLGLYCSSYLGVEQSLSKIRTGPPPKFRRWDGGGRLCSQLQISAKNPNRAVTWEKAISGQDSRLRIERQGKFHLIHVRLGSTNRDPIWVTCPIRLHRSLPEGVLIKWVYLTARACGYDGHNRTRFDYRLCFVASRPEGFAPTDRGIDGRVGVDVGWRLVPEGLRVAYWVGDDGAQGELVIPHQRLSYYHKPWDLQSIRDQSLDSLRAHLREFLANQSSLPPDLAAVAPHLERMRAPRKFLHLVNTWPGLPGDTDLVRHLREWRRQEIHLARWQGDQTRKFIRWRDHYYRNFWADLRRRYDTIVVEKLNVTAMRRRPEAEEEKAASGLVNYRNAASVGRLLELAPREGTVRLPPERTTIDCWVCAKPCDWDQGKELCHSCENCGARWDQDANAARNLLRRLEQQRQEEVVGSR